RPRDRYAPVPKISVVRRGPQPEARFLLPTCPGWLCCPPDTSGGKDWSLTGGGRGASTRSARWWRRRKAAVLVFGDGPGEAAKHLRCGRARVAVVDDEVAEQVDAKPAAVGGAALSDAIGV